MSRILKYNIVQSESIDDLVVSVQNRIADGWQPLSGPFYWNGRHYQAVVWTQEADERSRTPHEVPIYGQSEIELIEELTADDQPISRWEAGIDDGRNGVVGE